MPKLSVAEELKAAIKEAARSTSPSRIAAKELRQESPELLQPFADEWVDEKVASLIRDERAQQTRKRDPYRKLDLKPPARLKLKDGGSISGKRATLAQYTWFRRELVKTGHPSLPQIDKIIQFMSDPVRKQYDATLFDLVAEPS